MSSTGAGPWIRGHVDPLGAAELVHDEPWSTVSRVPVTGGSVWFKACSSMQEFEPALTACLFSRWPDRVGEVIAWDAGRGWLLLADGGDRFRELTDPVEAWLAALPLYSELQLAETSHVAEHLEQRVPDLRLASLPARFDQLLLSGLTLKESELAQLRRAGPRLGELCAELASFGIADTVQHNDLHQGNLFLDHGRPRVLDWGDTTISHPFFSLVATFHMIEKRYGRPPGDDLYDRFRDAYLEPWGPGWNEAFATAIALGDFVLAISWLRVRDGLPAGARPTLNGWIDGILRSGIARTPV